MRCAKHPFDRGHDVCTYCGLVYCAKCVVYPSGAGKEAFCIQCTVGLAVRTGGSLKPIKRRELRERRRQLADYLLTCPPVFEDFVELAPIVDPAATADSSRGPRQDRPVDWCA
jgi:hypothetical protein